MYNPQYQAWPKSRLPSRTVIDIENDPLLREFLQTTKDAVATATAGEHNPVFIADKIAGQVVTQTPQIDEDGVLHVRRQLTLGEVLGQPVECVDGHLPWRLHSLVAATAY